MTVTERAEGALTEWRREQRAAERSEDYTLGGYVPVDNLRQALDVIDTLVAELEKRNTMSGSGDPGPAYLAIERLAHAIRLMANNSDMTTMSKHKVADLADEALGHAGEIEGGYADRHQEPRANPYDASQPRHPSRL